MLEKTKIHEVILDSDVFINVPVLKHHGGTTLTMAMKNLMGIVWDRAFYHYKGLSQCIADFCLYRKPDLNIVDAYNIMTTSGPRGGVNLSHVKTIRNQLISTDMLAVDEAAAQIFNKVTDNVYNPYYMQLAEKMGIGIRNLKKIKIKRIKL